VTATFLELRTTRQIMSTRCSNVQFSVWPMSARMCASNMAALKPFVWSDLTTFYDLKYQRLHSPINKKEARLTKISHAHASIVHAS
jgi:putative flippase GtrA